MAINRARLRGIMVSGGIAAEAPALEFTEALDDEIDASQGDLATKQDLAALEDRLRLYLKQAVDHANTRLIAVVAIGFAVVSIVIAVT